MASLSEKIDTLLNPTPVVMDPEDDVNNEMIAKVQKSSDNDEAIFTRSELRSKVDLLLDGKKVSRNSLDKIFFDDSKNDSNSSESDINYSSSETDEDIDDDDDDDDDDGKLEKFQQMLSKGVDRDKESDEIEESDGSEDEASDDIANKFSNIGVTNEKEKGNCVKAQKELWNRLCESRIKLQKSLIIFNKLPQAECFDRCKMIAGENFANTIVCYKLKHLLNKCINLQEKILQNAPEFKNQAKVQKENANQSDEEIPSDTDEEMEVDLKVDEHAPKTKSLKRKLSCDEYNEELSKRYKSLIPHRHAIIQKWDEKTKLSSGKITQKSFAAFESSTLKLIEQVLQDENRLIKRTQLKRSLYRVLGKLDKSENEENPQNSESNSKQDMLLKDYDDEIFDDDDFYRQLLKEVIESKTAGINPDVLRKQMEIQSVRNKIKKKVDTKASKGRKIRYDTHQKLVGFMRKSETSTIPDDTRDSLLKSMFGR